MRPSKIVQTAALVLAMLGCLASAQEAAVVVEADGTMPVVEGPPEVSSVVNASATASEVESNAIQDGKTEEVPLSLDADKSPSQSGPLIDIFGPNLLSLEMIDESTAQLQSHLTTDALRGKKVIGVYFSADWCGPCRKFTPELVAFYDKMNSRRGRKDDFEIVWVSRCRDVNSYGQYFTHMGGWYALPPEEAMGARGAMLSEKYKVKGIPTLVLLDDMGSVITLDARNLIPKDKAGIGFPWRNPLATLYMTLVPRSLRLLVRSQIGSAKAKFVARVKQVVRPNNAKKVTA